MSLYKFKIYNELNIYRNLRSSEYVDMDVLQFSDFICKKLQRRTWRLPQRLKPGEPLERITNSDGNSRYNLTDRQYNKGRNVGKSIQQNCFICHKYLKSNGNTRYNQTSFRCTACKMPLCKKDRSDVSTGRLTTCLQEHQESNCKVVGCFGSDRTYTVFPRNLQLNLCRRGDVRRGRWDLVLDSHQLDEDNTDDEEEDYEEEEDNYKDDEDDDDELDSEDEEDDDVDNEDDDEEDSEEKAVQQKKIVQYPIPERTPKTHPIATNQPHLIKETNQPKKSTATKHPHLIKERIQGGK